MEPTRLVITLTPDHQGGNWLHWEYLGIFSDEPQAAAGQYLPPPGASAVAMYEVVGAWREHESRSLTLELDV